MARSKGEGTKPRLKKDGRYECKVMAAGRIKYFMGSSPAEASRRMREFLRSPEAVIAAKGRGGADTVSTALTLFLSGVKRTKSDGTWTSYESVTRVHIEPRIGALAPSKLSGRNVSGLLDTMEYDGVGARTRELAYIIMGAAFKATHPDLLDNVEKPSVEKEEMHPWSPRDRDRFMVHITDTGSRHFAFLRLLLSTGIRKGEALALTVNDVDLKTGRASIAKTWNAKRRKFGPPKTKKSRRNVKMPERTRIALRNWIMETGVRGDQRIFPFEERALDKATKKLMRAANVPVIRVHDLRHTFATVALVRGISPKVVQEMLGHASVKITLDTYSHVVPGMFEQAAEAIDAPEAAEGTAAM
jgi:integrase